MIEHENIHIDMGRKPKNKKVRTKLFENLKTETLQGVLAVIFIFIAIFFGLAAMGKAGFVGEKIYSFLKLFVGIGYFLLPLVSIMLAISFLKNLERRFGPPQFVGSLIFLISGLGMIALASSGKGGVIGNLTVKPLIKLLDIYATGILLIALIVISLLVLFEGTFSFSWIPELLERRRARKEDPEKLSKEESDKLEKDIEKRMENKAVPVTSATNQQMKGGRNGEDGFEPIKSKLLSLRPFTPPPLSLLERDRGRPEVGDIKANANIIKRTLQNFGIVVEMDEVSIGPSITRYALKPAEGVKLSKILGLQNNLELALAAHPVRIEAPIPGKSLVGIEIPNTLKTTVGLGSLLSENEFKDSQSPLLVSLGRGISGQSHFTNLARMPHLLIAGATGSGKSVTIHVLINSLLFRNPPETLKFIMIDPKRVELTLYNKIPHLLTPVITDAKKAILALKWLAKEMDRRYDLLEECSVRDVESYHKNILEPELKKIKNREKLTDEEKSGLPEMMPYIMVVIDELADIMQAYPRELESAIVRLAQMSRAVGIHLILSTQRPSVNVITGLIKANIPARIALQVTSQVDSRTILDSSGAEKLLGAGDMLFISGEMSKPKRIQSAFISETEVKRVVNHVAKEYENEIISEIDLTQDSSKNVLFTADEDEIEDELYEDARQTVIHAGKASTSYLQRKLGVGYARAARLIDMLEERGVVSPGVGSKPREILEKTESDDGSEFPIVESQND